MDVAEAIYRLLRNNVVPEDPDPSEDGIEATARFLEESENIVVPPRMVPDKVTYTILIQCCAYQGDLTRTLQIFIDMLSSPDPVAIWRGEDGSSARFVPVLPIYRAIFLGFYRHGADPRRPASATNSRQFSTNKTPWNADNLYAVYKSFLQLPRDQKPGDRVIYWLIMAFAKSTGYDTGKLRKVWKRLEKRFGNNWGLRLQRVRKSIYGNTEHTKAGYKADEGSEDDEDDE
jgi:pentatricopeptide repeat protein